MSAKTAATNTTAEAPAKRGPGRPRKDASATPAPKKAARKSATVTDISTAKRKPGRPSKAETEARKALAAKQEAQSQTASTAEPQRRRGRPLDPNSTMGQARTIFGLVKDKSRKNIVDLLHNQLGIDKNIAGVYYHQLARDMQ